MVSTIYVMKKIQDNDENFRQTGVLDTITMVSGQTATSPVEVPNGKGGGRGNNKHHNDSKTCPFFLTSSSFPAFATCPPSPPSPPLPSSPVPLAVGDSTQEREAHLAAVLPPDGQQQEEKSSWMELKTPRPPSRIISSEYPSSTSSSCLSPSALGTCGAKMIDMIYYAKDDPTGMTTHLSPHTETTQLNISPPWSPTARVFPYHQESIFGLKGMNHDGDFNGTTAAEERQQQDHHHQFLIDSPLIGDNLRETYCVAGYQEDKKRDTSVAPLPKHHYYTSRTSSFDVGNEDNEDAFLLMEPPGDHNKQKDISEFHTVFSKDEVNSSSHHFILPNNTTIPATISATTLCKTPSHSFNHKFTNDQSLDHGNMTVTLRETVTDSQMQHPPRLTRKEMFPVPSSSSLCLCTSSFCIHNKEGQEEGGKQQEQDNSSPHEVVENADMIDIKKNQLHLHHDLKLELHGSASPSSLLNIHHSTISCSKMTASSNHSVVCTIHRHQKEGTVASSRNFSEANSCSSCCSKKKNTTPPIPRFSPLLLPRNHDDQTSSRGMVVGATYSSKMSTLLPPDHQKKEPAVNHDSQKKSGTRETNHNDASIITSKEINPEALRMVPSSQFLERGQDLADNTCIHRLVHSTSGVENLQRCCCSKKKSSCIPITPDRCQLQASKEKCSLPREGNFLSFIHEPNNIVQEFPWNNFPNFHFTPEKEANHPSALSFSPTNCNGGHSDPIIDKGVIPAPEALSKYIDCRVKAPHQNHSVLNEASLLTTSWAASMMPSVKAPLICSNQGTAPTEAIPSRNGTDCHHLDLSYSFLEGCVTSNHHARQDYDKKMAGQSDLQNVSSFIDMATEESYYDQVHHIKKGQRRVASSSPEETIVGQISETLQSTSECNIVKRIRFRDFQSATWTLHLEEARRFRDKYGHCRIPNYYSENPDLGRWAKRQRHQYKHYIKQQHTKPDFQNINDSEDATDDDYDDDNSASNGMATTKESSNESKSSTTRRRTSTLTAERIEALEEIGFCWDVRLSTWSDRFEELKLFIKKHGHPNVPIQYSANLKLAGWVKIQRHQYKRWKEGLHSKITAERIELLESIGFNWVKQRAPSRQQKRKIMSSVGTESSSVVVTASNQGKRRGTTVLLGKEETNKGNKKRKSGY